MVPVEVSSTLSEPGNYLVDTPITSGYCTSTNLCSTGGDVSVLGSPITGGCPAPLLLGFIVLSLRTVPARLDVVVSFAHKFCHSRCFVVVNPK